VYADTVRCMNFLIRYGTWFCPINFALPTDIC